MVKSKPLRVIRAPSALFVRGISAKVADRIRSGAGARHMTLGDYLTELVRLHDDLLVQSSGGDQRATSTLRARGLETVTT